MKKFTVIAAAFAMLFAVSSCSDPNGKANPDKKAGDNTTTAAAADAASDAGSTSGGEQSGGGQSSGQSSQTVTTVAVYETMIPALAYLSFYSDNTWKLFLNFEGVFEAYESGTYTGNPAQDGAVTAILTKMANNSGELEDCTPETMNLTITDGIFEINGSSYFIRKSDVVATYGCLMPSNDDVVLVTYRFYEDNTWRIFLNGSLYALGVYEGDPSVDGQVSMEMKYGYSETDGLEEANNEYTFGIEDDCFTGVLQDEIVVRELEVFKYSETNDSGVIINSFIKFYADSDDDEDTDGTFLYTETMMGIEIPCEYGTYTGNPNSTEANTSISLNTTYFYTYNPTTEEGTWGEVLESTYDILTLNNNQLIDGTYIFIRQ